MSLSDFANVVVSTDGPALSQVGFGTILFASYHTKFAERSRTYTSATGVSGDGFATDSPEYAAAQRVFSQSPRPPSMKIGRLASAPVPTTRLVPVVSTVARTYAITVYGEGLTEDTVEYAAAANATVDAICDGLQTAFAAAFPVGVTVTPSGATATHLDITCPAGKIVFFSDWDHNFLQLEDRTPDPGIATDLDAIRTEDGDWYGLAISCNSAAILEEAADWAETQDVILFGNTSDTGARTVADDTNIGPTLTAKSYVRSAIWFDKDDTGGYLGLGAAAERFPFDPGAQNAGGTFHGKTIRGVTADALTPTEKGELREDNKRYNVYITTAGRAHTLDGVTPSGEFIDVTRFLDWFRIRLQERIATLILDNDRVPYTDAGISLIKAAVLAQIQAGLRSGGIAPTDDEGNPPVVTAPLVSETDQADRAARVLRNVQASFRLAGAIHLVDPITVTVSV